jgi:hypothetical protein
MYNIKNLTFGADENPVIAEIINSIRTQFIGYFCPECNDLLYSKNRHDYKVCKCGKYSIDGGHDYIKVGGVDLEKIKLKKLWIYNRQINVNDIKIEDILTSQTRNPFPLGEGS